MQEIQICVNVWAVTPMQRCNDSRKRSPRPLYVLADSRVHRCCTSLQRSSRHSQCAARPYSPPMLFSFHRSPPPFTFVLCRQTAKSDNALWLSMLGFEKSEPEKYVSIIRTAGRETQSHISVRGFPYCKQATSKVGTHAGILTLRRHLTVQGCPSCNNLTPAHGC